MRLHVHGMGDRPSLLLVHGLSSSHHVWQRNVATLGAEHDLYMAELFDRRAGRRFNVAEQAEALVGALAARGLTRSVSIIGHSLGGLLAMHIALSRPALVDRLVLVAAPAVPVRQPALRRLRSLVTFGGIGDLRSVGVVASAVLLANPLQLVAATGAALRTNLESVASRILTPTLVVWGERDGLVPLEVGRSLSAALPSARLEVIAAAGHQPQWEAPDAFHAAVLPFLSPAGTPRHDRRDPSPASAP